MTKQPSSQADWVFDKHRGPIELDGPAPAGPFPEVMFVWPWEAALWRAFGTVEQFAGVLPRSFDQGTLMPMPPESSNSPDAVRVRAEQQRRAEWHRKFDEAEQVLIRLLASGQVSAEGRKPFMGPEGKRVDRPTGEHNLIRPQVFFRSDLAFGPSGELLIRAGTLESLFPPYDARGTDADPSIPLYFDVLIPVAKLRELWGVTGNSAANVTRRIAAEQTLQKWLEAWMVKSPKKSPGKAKVLKDAREAGYSISGAAFNGVFAAAVKETKAVAWSSAGRKSKRVID